jgi:hypothetical protein
MAPRYRYAGRRRADPALCREGLCQGLFRGTGRLRVAHLSLAKVATVLKTRTLTNLYNERPTWLDDAHSELDTAVAAAYGWPVDIAVEEALSRLLALNLERAALK